MDYPEQTYYPGVFPSLPNTGTLPEGYSWTNPLTVVDGTSWWPPLPAEPAPTCEHCKRCSACLGELIKLCRETIDRAVMLAVEMRRINALSD